jgi:hypothetical protein
MKLPRRRANVVLLTACVLAASSVGATAQAPAKDDPWRAVRFLVGDWEGESDGQPGQGTLKRSYRFVLGSRFLHEQNVSTYPPQPKNEKGEVHEHWSLFSVDRARKTIVFRQFHQEGFVNQYVMLPETEPNTVVLETEALENVPSGWKARESYTLVSADEFVETFELAQAGGSYQVYSRSRLKRASHATAARAAAPNELRALGFLLGDWQAEASGKPGEASGGFSFSSSLQDRVVVRTNWADYPATPQKPASRHDDLMVIQAGETGLRADYYDSEGHVIRYAGTASEDSLTLTSDVVSSAPRFRLSYKLGSGGSLEGRFEIAPPGRPDAFAPYLAWTARRLAERR